MLSNFVFQSPGDVALNLFGFRIYFYGLILAFAIFVGYFTAYKLFKNFYDSDKAGYITEITPYLIILGIIGARLYYCTVNSVYYSSHLTGIFNIRQGGLSIHGMILFGVLSLFWFSKLYKIEFAKLTDVFLCGSILAQSIGRWGNFFNSEAFGFPTNLPWKLFIPASHRPLEYMNYEYFHPAFLYESILDLIIFLILISQFKKLSKTPGVCSCLYLILYSAARIIVEKCRIDSALNIYNIPIAQIVSLIIIIISFIFLIFIKYKQYFMVLLRKKNR